MHHTQKNPQTNTILYPHTHTPVRVSCCCTCPSQQNFAPTAPPHLLALMSSSSLCLSALGVSGDCMRRCIRSRDGQLPPDTQDWPGGQDWDWT